MWAKVPYFPSLQKRKTPGPILLSKKLRLKFNTSKTQVSEDVKSYSLPFYLHRDFRHVKLWGKIVNVSEAPENSGKGAKRGKVC